MSTSSLVYISRSRIDEGRFREAALRAVLETSRRRNASDGITGVLLYGEGEFVQLLEGPQDAVEACYARILRDQRHEEVQLVASNSTAGRLFTGWSMAYAGLEDVSSIRGGVELHQLRRGEPGAAQAVNAMLRMARSQLA